MRLTLRSTFTLGVAWVLLLAATASAQYQPYKARKTNTRATGETWHVEASVGMSNPAPDIVVSSKALGIIGSEISAVDDLGITKQWQLGLNLTLRPAKKHKFRFAYSPLKYTAETIMQRTVVFNGQAFVVGLPVNSEIKWGAYRFGYEYDFLYHDRWFVGFILDAKYSNIEVTLQNPLTVEWAKVKAPIPTAGGIVRVYPVANISITGEFTGFKLPHTNGVLEGYDGKWYDWEVYGTVNITDHLGLVGGYHSVDVEYRKDADRGTLLMKGPYFKGVLRF
jgi:hypothetical protein